ncbi:MAG: hypothetical protein MK116_05360 [Phycisphaerales bacterium]|nr:hypothetical protein [Phycisphaerales bacterium]
MTDHEQLDPAAISPLTAEHEAESNRTPVEKAELGEAARPGADTGEATGRLELEYLPWGEPAEGQSGPPCAVLATCGWIELEYAVMRRGCGLLDQPHRATVAITGTERVDLLDRMVTQDLGTLSPGRACHAFLTGRTGRIIAELILLAREDDVLIDVDVHQAGAVVEILEHHVFTEDVQIEDATSRWYRIGLHGPETSAVLAGLGGLPESSLEVITATIAETPVSILRRDVAATTGCDLFVPRDRVVEVWKAIRQQAQIVGARARTVGWYAFNTARLEGGTPLFNIDYGPTNLPHETGLIDQCVSFTKGCYPGQEVVARMQHLGKPKQQLRGLRLQADLLPVAGAQVFEVDEDALSEPVGVVTSSGISPLLGAVPLAFGMLRSKVTADGTRVRVHAEGEVGEAIVGGLDMLETPGGTP